MRKVALLLACLSGTSRGRRLQVSDAMRFQPAAFRPSTPGTRTIGSNAPAAARNTKEASEAEDTMSALDLSPAEESAVLCAMARHEEEVAAAPRVNTLLDRSLHDFSDADFDEFGGGEDATHAGPDAPDLAAATSARTSTRVYRTVSRVLDDSECQKLREEASTAVAKGISSRFTYEAEARVAEVRLKDLPEASMWLQEKLGTTFFPLIASRYGINASSLYLSDSLIIKYDASRNATRMPTHRDGALFSLNVALNDASEYTGGGTWFEPFDEIVRLSKGKCVCHSSGLRHSGNTITSGERWILVIFVRATEYPQLAQRCLEISGETKGWAMHAQSENQFEEAEVLFNEAKAAADAALTLAPHHFEAFHAVGELYDIQGMDLEARFFLHAAVTMYPLCPHPRLDLGNSLVRAGRPRAALRQYEAVLRQAESNAETDNDQSINFRIAQVQKAAENGAFCVVLLLERYGVAPISLETAMSWIYGALDAVDGTSPSLQQLLKRALALRDGKLDASGPAWLQNAVSFFSK